MTTPTEETRGVEGKENNMLESQTSPVGDGSLPVPTESLMVLDWTCSGCGIPSPHRIRVCECPTNCVSRAGETAWKRYPGQPGEPGVWTQDPSDYSWALIDDDDTFYRVHKALTHRFEWVWVIAWTESLYGGLRIGNGYASEDHAKAAVLHIANLSEDVLDALSRSQDAAGGDSRPDGEEQG